MGPLVDTWRSQGHDGRDRAGQGGRWRDPLRWRAARRATIPGGHYVTRVSPRPRTSTRSSRMRPSRRLLYIIEYGDEVRIRRLRWTTSDRDSQRRAAGAELGDLHDQHARGRAFPDAQRQRLRHCQCEHRHQRRRDWRGVRWREGDRRRPRVGQDSWKAYMRRQTNTINWGTELPLAQGIKFGD
jgi:hypothetical protein